MHQNLGLDHIFVFGDRMIHYTQPMTPVLKWAGGKKQLLTAIRSMLPAEYDCYYEPFVGGGAVLFSVAPRKAVINDINTQLVNLYRQLQGAPEQIIEYVNILDAVHCDKDYYLSMRQKYNRKISANELDAECAALMIWINKHCFNGLYRVNRKGLFNVPYNNKSIGRSIDENNIRSIGEYLQKSDITMTCSDFEEVCRHVKPNDFVYFDSPYVPESKTADFTSYSRGGFEMADHERLARLFKRLDQIGAKLMLSNNDVEIVRELYCDYRITHLDVKRMINCDATKRNGKEVIITNYIV